MTNMVGAETDRTKGRLPKPRSAHASCGEIPSFSAEEKKVRMIVQIKPMDTLEVPNADQQGVLFTTVFAKDFPVG